MVKVKLVSSAVAGAVVLVLVSACSTPQSGSVGTPVESGSGQPTASASAVPAEASKASAREIAQANLHPCPPSDKAIESVPGGLPDVTLACLGEGPEVDLAGLRGRPLVVNVWASWCGPCRAELPILGAVSEQTRGKIDFLGVNVSDTRKSGLEMAGTYKMRFPSVFDPTFASRQGLRVSGVPLTLFVRPSGTIAYRHNGPITSEDQLKQLIASSLGVTV